MYETDITQATAAAGQLAMAWKAKNEEAEKLAGPEQAAKLAEAQDLSVKLTEANVQLRKARASKQAHDEAAEIASQFLEPVGKPPAKAPEPEPSETAAKVDGGREKLVKAALLEATRAFYRSGGDVKAALEVCSERKLKPAEIATLVAADTRKGGILVMPELGEMRTGRFAPGVMRKIADIQTTSSDTLIIPRLTGELVTPNITPEGYEHTTRQDIDFAGVEIKLFDWHPLPIVVSQKLLRNQGAQIERIISDRIMRRKELDEDEMFFNGDGAGEPYGINRESITAIASLSATGLTWAGIINWIYGLPAEWSNGAEAVMRRSTYAAILGTADPAGHYIFNLSSQAAPNSVLGVPVNFTDAMPAITADAYPAIVGWWKAYTIVDGVGGMTIKRLEEKYDPNVGFSVLSEIGGRTVELDAFRRLKIALTV